MRPSIGLLVALLSLSTVAHAADAAIRARDERARRSRAHFDLGELEASRNEVEEGYRAQPMPRFRYHLEQSARRAEPPPKAWEKEGKRTIAEPEPETAAPTTRPPSTATELAPAATGGGAGSAATVESAGDRASRSASTRLLRPSGPRLLHGRAWYRDWLGWALATTGAFAITVTAVDLGVNYPAYAHAEDSLANFASYQKSGLAPRLTADVVVMAVGAALVAGGAVRFALVAAKSRRERLSFLPVGDSRWFGVALGGRF